MAIIGTVSNAAICNMALNSIGTKPISSLTENSKPARKCYQYFPFVRDAVLRDYPWNFATWTVQLSLSDDTVLHPDYSYAYVKPNDCIAVRWVGTEEAAFRIEGERILSNQEAAIAYCTFRVVDPTKFDTSFVLAFADLLASVLAVPIRGSKKLRDDYFQKYFDSLNVAQVNDAREMQEEIDDDDRYISARR